MSDVNTQAAASAASDEFAGMSEDEALGAMFDQATSEEGQTRGADGRFASENPPAEGEVQPPEDIDEPVGEGDEPQHEEGEPPASTVPLPPNWTGLDEDWKKIPADVQAKIAARDQELHSRMSEQGRQIGALRPVTDVLERNRDLIDGKQLMDGTPVTPQLAMDLLLTAQRQLETDPVRALLDIAERFEVLPMLQAVLSGQVQLPPPTQPQGQAGMSPADVQRIARETLQSDQEAKTANEEVSRLSADKPLYSQIAEADMVDFIHKARHRLGDTAANAAVFDLAYDMAVHADPDLRGKAAAAAKPPAASKTDERTQAARRAASINVTSRSTGNGRKLTEDEELAVAFDAAHKDR